MAIDFLLLFLDGVIAPLDLHLEGVGELEQLALYELLNGGVETLRVVVEVDVENLPVWVELLADEHLPQMLNVLEVAYGHFFDEFVLFF